MGERVLMMHLVNELPRGRVLTFLDRADLATNTRRFPNKDHRWAAASFGTAAQVFKSDLAEQQCYDIPNTVVAAENSAGLRLSKVSACSLTSFSPNARGCFGGLRRRAA